MNYQNFDKKRILVFGDSNTYGHDTVNNTRFDDNTRFPCALQNRLGQQYTVIEEGLPGRTSVFDDPLGEGLRGLDYITPCMNSHSPIDIAIICLGTNDCKERFGCNATLIAGGIIRLANKVRASTAFRDEAKLLIVCPAIIKPEYCTIGVYKNDMGLGCDIKSAQLCDTLKTACKNAKYDFLDANSIAGVENNTMDFMHLTATAHLALADALYAIIIEKRLL